MQPLYALYQAPPSASTWNPIAINDNGVVLGLSYFSDAIYSTVIWDGGPPKTLPFSVCWPFAIDDSGQIVGAQPYASQSSKAFLYDSGSGQMKDLSQNVGVGVPDYAVDINDSGLIAGNSGNPAGSPYFSDPTKVFLYDSTADTLVAVLDTPAGSVGVTAIALNANGHLVGHLYSPLLQQSMFIRTDGNTIENLGIGQVTAVNKFDVLTGRTMFSDGQHAFRLSAATPDPNPIELAPPNCMSSVGWDINDDGIVVLDGVYAPDHVVGFVAFPPTSNYAGIWDLKNSLSTDVPVSIDPRAINNKGQIAALASDVQGNYVAVRLDPMTEGWAAIGKEGSRALLEFIRMFGGAPVGGGGWGLTGGGQLIPIPPRQDFIAFWQRLPRSAKEAAVAEAIRKLAFLIDDPLKRNALQSAALDLLKGEESSVGG